MTSQIKTAITTHVIVAALYAGQGSTTTIEAYVLAQTVQRAGPAVK
jgi:hypothetical protein